MNNHYAWTWKIKNEYLDEYVNLHQNPWPEILEEHTKAGIKNYSIFQNGNQFFYYFECNNIKEAFSYISNSQVCKKWNDITTKMVEDSFDYNQENPIRFMNRVFYLE